MSERTATRVKLPAPVAGAALATGNMEALGAALLLGVAVEMSRELDAVASDGRSVAVEAVERGNMEALGLTLLLGVVLESQKGSELAEQAYKQALVAEA